MESFMIESEIYDLLNEYGITPPNYLKLTSDTKLPLSNFLPEQKVVMKGLADNLWHKSDVGALYFTTNTAPELTLKSKMIKDALIKEKYTLKEIMVAELIDFKKLSGLPTEFYVSLKKEGEMGVVIRLSLGGIHTEMWASELKDKILTLPVDYISLEESLVELRSHLIGKILLGTLRQGKPLVTERRLEQLVKSLFSLASHMNLSDISFIEINPLVVDSEGHFRPLDGVGQREKIVLQKSRESFSSPDLLLKPERIAIAGVSNKPGSFGKRIFENLKRSSLQNENLLVIKPEGEIFEGVKVVPSIKGLIDQPVDNLILVLPAKVTIDTIEELIAQGAGAEVVYIVAGGIGDGGDSDHLSERLRLIIDQAHDAGKWTPRLIGPNSLGIVLSSLNLSTLFISPEKLPIQFAPKGNLALISQSGAFFITKISNNEDLPIKNGFCIGNQFDLRLSDFLEAVANDDGIQVVAVYAEGFQEDDFALFCKRAKRLIGKGKRVILYKGGRSESGMKAAAGHTGAMASNFELQKRVLELSDVIVTETFSAFTQALTWYTAYPSLTKVENLALLMNAGYESVASADWTKSLYTLTETGTDKLKSILHSHGLSALVSPSNPLDLTPMADESAYLASLEHFFQEGASAAIVALVPLTDKLETFNQSKSQEFAAAIRALAWRYQKPIAIIVDSGDLYKEYKKVFKQEGLPVFNSIEEPLQLFSSMKS